MIYVIKINQSDSSINFFIVCKYAVTDIGVINYIIKSVKLIEKNNF